MSSENEREETNEIQQITDTLAQLEITIARLNQRRDTLLTRCAQCKSNRKRATKAEFKIGDLVIVKDN